MSDIDKVEEILYVDLPDLCDALENKGITEEEIATLWLASMEGLKVILKHKLKEITDG